MPPKGKRVAFTSTSIETPQASHFTTQTTHSASVETQPSQQFLDATLTNAMAKAKKQYWIVQVRGMSFNFLILFFHFSIDYVD